jgi:23S rRNA pseudouridine955/2504/2580 synthase
MPISLTAADDDSGRRLDRILRKALPDLPLSAIHRLLRKGSVLVNGEKAAINYRAKAGQIITLPDGVYSKGSQPQSLIPKPQSPVPIPHSPLPDIILFEGAGLLILNKPAGLRVHGRESLEDLVLSYLEPKLPTSLSFRPGPLHRLDRPTSGIIAFSTNLEGARFFSAMMRNRMLKKQYLALVSGVIEKTEIWEDKLVRDGRRKKTFRSFGEAKTALTKITPLLGDGVRTLVLAEIETGRTHQIRAQAAAHGHPLLGDKKYGAMQNEALDYTGRFLLHAWRMEFPENTDNSQYEGLPWGLPRCIEAPLPEKFLEKIQKNFGKGIISDLFSQL